MLSWSPKWIVGYKSNLWVSGAIVSANRKGCLYTSTLLCSSKSSLVFQADFWEQTRGGGIGKIPQYQSMSVHAVLDIIHNF